MSVFRDAVRGGSGNQFKPSASEAAPQGRFADAVARLPKKSNEAQSVADEIRSGEYRPPETRWVDYTPAGLLHNAISGRSFSSRVDPFIRNVGAQTMRPVEAARDFYWDATDHPSADKPRTDAFSASQATARAQKGAAATAGRVVGEVVNPFYLAPGLGVAAGGARLGLRGYRLAAAAGMADAFLGGGIEGYLESEGDTFDDKLEDAARSAFIAAPIGGLAGVGLEGLGRAAFGKAFSGFPETQVGPAERAAADATREAESAIAGTALPRYQFSPGTVQARRLSRKANRARTASLRAEPRPVRDLVEAGIGRTEARAIFEPPRIKGASGGQMALFSDPALIQTTARVVTDGIKAGKWAAGHTVAASRWLASRGAKAVIDASAAARELIGQFGRGIRRHVPRIWSEYRSFAQSRNVPSRRNVGAVGKGVSPKRLARRVESLESRLDKAVLRGREQVAKIKGLQKAKVERYDALVKRARTLLPKKDQHLALGAFHRVKTPAAFDKAVAKLDEQVTRIVRQEARMAELRQAIKEIIPADRRASFREKFNVLRTDGDLAKALNTVVEYARGREVAVATRANMKVAKKGVKGLAGIETYPAAAEAVERLRALGINPAEGWSGQLRSHLTKLPVDEQAVIVAEIKAAREALSAAKAAPERQAKAWRAKASEKLIAETRASRDRKFIGKPGESSLRKSGAFSRFFKEAHLNPEALTEMMGDSFTRLVYEPMRRGQANAYNAMRGATEHFESLMAKAGLGEGDARRASLFKAFARDKDSSKTFNLDSGESVDLTRLERAYLYASLSDNETRALVREGKPFQLGRDPTRQFKLTEGDILKIVQSISDDERAFADAVSATARFMYDDVNAAHVRLTGQTLPKNESYLFRRVAGEPEATIFDGALKMDADPSAASQSFVKARTKDTERPLLIGNLLLDFDRHIQRSAAYAHLAVPAKLVKSLFRQGALANEVGMAWGRQRPKWFETWVQDVVNDAAMFIQPKEGALGIMAKAVDNVAKGVLGANPAVIAKQFPSILNAVTEMDARTLSAALAEGAWNPLAKSGREARRRMLKHSGLIWARYRMHASRVAGVIENKGAHVVGGTRSLSDKAMKGIEQMDMAVISTIWRAAEMTVKKASPDLAGDAFYRAVDDLADKVIRRTQPNFAYVNLSQTARQSRQNPALKLMTMFMSQRNTNYNMAARAIATGDPARIAAVLGVVAVAQPAMIAGIDQGKGALYANSRPEDETAGLRALDFGLTAGENLVGNLYFSAHLTGAMRHLRQKYLLDQNYPYRDPKTPVMGQLGDLLQGALIEIDLAAKQYEGETLTQADYDRAIRGAEKILTGGTGLAGLPVQGPYRAVRGISRRITGEAE